MRPRLLNMAKGRACCKSQHYRHPASLLRRERAGWTRGNTDMPEKSDDQGAAATEKAPHYHGHRARLRQRFLDAGSEAVSDYELLELILFRAIPQRDVKPLAKELIATFGSFAEVIAAPRQRLAELKGLGDAAITELKVVQAAASRIARGAVSKRPVLSSWSSVLDYCRTAQGFAEKEQFRILFLDKRNAAIADIARPLGISVHDHIIVGKHGHASLKAMRLI